MAKKISVEEYEKQQQEKNSKSNYNNQKDKVKTISLIVNCLLVIWVIILIVICSESYSEEEYNTMLERKNDEIYDLEYDLDQILRGKDRSYVEDKLDFMDENVVFWIEGYGNKYYSYDCMMKKVGYEKYSFMAYNEEAAKGEGLTKGSCK